MQVEVCELSGMIPTDACPFRHNEWFIEGIQPASLDTFFKRVTIDLATGHLADETTPPERKIIKTALDLPSQAYPWARNQGFLLLHDLEIRNSSDFSQPTSSKKDRLQVVSPAGQSVFNLTSDIPIESQRIHI